MTIAMRYCGVSSRRVDARIAHVIPTLCSVLAWFAPAPPYQLLSQNLWPLPLQSATNSSSPDAPPSRSGTHPREEDCSSPLDYQEGAGGNRWSHENLKIRRRRSLVSRSILGYRPTNIALIIMMMSEAQNTLLCLSFEALTPHNPHVQQR